MFKREIYGGRRGARVNMGIEGSQGAGIVRLYLCSSTGCLRVSSRVCVT